MAQMPINEISWTEIPCTDVSRARTFYGTVFGWSFEESPAPGHATANCPVSPVVLFSHGGMKGSFVKVEKENFLSPSIHPSNSKAGEKPCIAVRVTITVESLDAKLVEVEKAGGAMFIPKRVLPNNMGCTAYFTDSEGNVMGLWSMT